MFRRIGFALIIFSIVITLGACGIAQSVLPVRTTAQANEYIIHVVQPGETASQIATRYHITIEQLIALNVEKYPALARDPSLLQVGWRLRVPAPGMIDSASATMVSAQADLISTARVIVEQVNEARARRGLLLLRNDATLTRIAADRCNDMIARQYFSHYDPATGQEPLLRYLQATKFSYRYAGENIAEIKNDAGWVPPWLTIAARYTTDNLASEFVRGWLNSPEHRANIYSANYRRTGVALAVSSDGRRIVATQVFAD